MQHGNKVIVPTTQNGETTDQEGEVVSQAAMSVTIKLDNGGLVNLPKGTGQYFAKEDDKDATEANRQAMTAEVAETTDAEKEGQETDTKASKKKT